MTSLKESVAKELGHWNCSNNCEIHQGIVVATDKTIKELEEHMQQERPPYHSAEMHAAYNDSLATTLRFLRGENK